MSISTGFPLFRIFFFHGSYNSLLPTKDVSAIGASTASGVSPVGLVHCTAPAPLSLLVHGTLFLLPCIRVSVCPLFSTLTSRFLLFSPSSRDALCLPLRWLQISVPSFLLSSLVLYFFPGKTYISAIPFFTSLGKADISLCQVSQSSHYQSILPLNCSMFVVPFLFQSPPQFLFIFKLHRK